MKTIEQIRSESACHPGRSYTALNAWLRQQTDARSATEGHILAIRLLRRLGLFAEANVHVAAAASASEQDPPARAEVCLAAAYLQLACGRHDLAANLAVTAGGLWLILRRPAHVGRSLLALAHIDTNAEVSSKQIVAALGLFPRAWVRRRIAAHQLLAERWATTEPRRARAALLAAAGECPAEDLDARGHLHWQTGRLEISLGEHEVGWSELQQAHQDLAAAGPWDRAGLELDIARAANTMGKPTESAAAAAEARAKIAGLEACPASDQLSEAASRLE